MHRRRSPGFLGQECQEDAGLADLEENATASARATGCGKMTETDTGANTALSPCLQATCFDQYFNTVFSLTIQVLAIRKVLNHLLLTAAQPMHRGLYWILQT
jgi:hypothetical protein